MAESSNIISEQKQLRQNNHTLLLKKHKEDNKLKAERHQNFLQTHKDISNSNIELKSESKTNIDTLIFSNLEKKKKHLKILFVQNYEKYLRLFNEINIHNKYYQDLLLEQNNTQHSQLLLLHCIQKQQKLKLELQNKKQFMLEQKNLLDTYQIDYNDIYNNEVILNISQKMNQDIIQDNDQKSDR